MLVVRLVSHLIALQTEFEAVQSTAGDHCSAALMVRTARVHYNVKELHPEVNRGGKRLPVGFGPLQRSS